MHKIAYSTGKVGAMGRANTHLNLNLLYNPAKDEVYLVGWVEHPITKKQVIVSQTDITRDFEMIEQSRKERNRGEEGDDTGDAE